MTNPWYQRRSVWQWAQPGCLYQRSRIAKMTSKSCAKEQEEQQHPSERRVSSGDERIVTFSATRKESFGWSCRNGHRMTVDCVLWLDHFAPLAEQVRMEISAEKRVWWCLKGRENLQKCWIAHLPLTLTHYSTPSVKPACERHLQARKCLSVGPLDYFRAGRSSVLNSLDLAEGWNQNDLCCSLEFLGIHKCSNAALSCAKLW